MKKELKKQNGITLVALVITIVILLILSSIITYTIDMIDFVVFKKSRQENAVNASKKFSKDLW